MAPFVLFAIFILLQAADIWTTYVLLSAGGRELNKWMRYSIDRLGLVPGLLLPKLAMVAFLYAAMLWFEWVARTFYGHWASPLALVLEYVILAGGVALYAWVVWHNWREMRR